jgi:hypothetical protein
MMRAPMGHGTTYLLLGHPSHIGNLSTQDHAEALAWFDENREKFPEHPIRVEIVQSNRYVWLDQNAPRPERV